MHELMLSVCLLALAGPQVAATAGEGVPALKVVFVQPESYTDVRDRLFASAPEKNPNLNGLRRYLETRAARHLAQGRHLTIEFTDIDLAGDHRAQTTLALSDVRLISSLYPPTLEFNYRLADADGRLLKSGEVKLRELGFDTTSSGTDRSPLRHERRMLDEWLRQEIRGQ
jgi:hypothetical protein